MNRPVLKTWVGALLLCLASPVLAEEEPIGEGWHYDEGLGYEAPGGNLSLDFYAQFDGRFTGKDPELGESAESFDIPFLKLRLDATAYKTWDFRLQLDPAMGSESGQNLLEDAFVVYRKYTMARFWFGQGKVFFGRQQLASTGELLFMDRSIAAEEFSHTKDRIDNRDVGLALYGKNKKKTYAYYVGVYNGNGINKDEKDNSDYMAVARLVAMPFGEFEPKEAFGDPPRKSKLAFGVSVMTVNRGTGAVAEEVRDTTAGFELAYRFRGFNLSTELFSRSEDVPLGAPLTEEDADGGYLQMGYLFKNGFEVALRYAEIVREIVDSDETEAGIAFNYYISGNRRKIQTEFRRLEFEGEPISGRIDTNEFKVQLQLIF
jgi:hypothetical protein